MCRPADHPVDALLAPAFPNKIDFVVKHLASMILDNPRKPRKRASPKVDGNVRQRQIEVATWQIAAAQDHLDAAIGPGQKHGPEQPIVHVDATG
jgi:hypothetical protein